jgi:catechol 2,3-dioxygenase-like lactoylglutathione lyase family enzyme
MNGEGEVATKRIGTPWMPADAFGRTLEGFGVNLLVRDIEASVAFATRVLGAGVVYEDADFAVLRRAQAQWLLHADHTYEDNPLHGFVAGDAARGVGVELRLYGCDPDVAEAAARAEGHIVLAGAADKPHGLREAYLLDVDGYCWVASRKI